MKKIFSLSNSIVLGSMLFYSLEKISDGLTGVSYGLPFKFVTLYVENPDKFNILHNLFNGNSGMNINFLSYIVNVFIIYKILYFINLKVEKKLNK